MDERTLNDLLECSVCLERLDTSSKVLPCQHTFCRKCLEVIVSSHNELRCPECRILVNLKVDELPPNVLLMRILEGMKNASNQQQSNNKAGLIQELQAEIQSKQQQQQHQLPQPQMIMHHKKDGSQRIIEHNHKGRDHHKSVYPVPSGSHAIVPHAKALYDFQSKEPNDLSFKKGEIIFLRKRIDHNWYLGEMKGKEGAFPINHVQIVVPLPMPQCRALYDFRMGPNEEEGCLIFKKGSYINVIRRVDQNWAEGRIGDCIGIFPIAFVEMNQLAKQLMEVNSCSDIPNNTTRTIPPTPFESNSSESSSTLPTSPNSSSSNDNSNISTPSSSLSPVENRQIAAIPSIAQPQAKIVPAIPTETAATNVQPSTNPTNTPQIAEPQSQPTVVIPNNPEPRVGHHEARPIPSERAEAINSRSKPSSKHNHPSLPATYVAVYPYKPQKSDELELRKGAFYSVTERCQDGWFKGTSSTKKSGVFPGNYVTSVKALQRSQQTAQPQHPQHQHVDHMLISPRYNQPPHHQSGHAAAVSKQPITSPPELPPRYNNGTPPTASGGGRSKTLGQHVEMLLGRKPTISSADKKDPSNSTASGGGGGATGGSSAVNLMKRLTNNMTKRSKSPTNGASASYSMDNPVFDDSFVQPSSSKQTTAALAHGSVHVRSGSCPSQLLQSVPVEYHGQASHKIIAEGSHPFGFASQRVKPIKERPSLSSIKCNKTAENGATKFEMQHAQQREHGGHSGNACHRKSQSLDAATISAQLNGAAAQAKPKPQRFRCIVPYPPNSQYELELHLGDIVFVHKKRDNGWYKGTHAQSGKTGLFPASFVEPDI